MGRDCFFHVIRNALPAEMCAFIARDATRLDLRPAAVVKRGIAQVDNVVRRARFGYWPTEHWIEGLLAHFAASANSVLWQFVLSLPEAVQYVEYPPGGHHVWHRDEFDLPMDDAVRPQYAGLNRKLSIRMDLSEPGSYAGGDTMIRLPLGSEKILTELSDPGSITVFPSYVPVRVTPVTRGVRKYIEAWVMGPQFR